MSFTPKKLLLILDLNHALFYLKNSKITETNLGISHIKIPYHLSYHHYNISLRKGRPELLEGFFSFLKKDIDIAIWSSLSQQFTNDICHQYFTRYYRDLLFIMATNRELYGNLDMEKPIKIRRDLTNVYSKFPGYNEGNTLVISTAQNLMEKHKKNDLLIPSYSPEIPEFQSDAGLVPLIKYIQGLLLMQEEHKITDIRRFTTAKEVKNIFNRMAHNYNSDKEYN